MPQPAGRSTRRARGERKPREERWVELIAVATQVFYEKGYDAASLQDIADRLGMLKGSLYYYMQSKEDLLFDVISTVHKQGLDVVRTCSQVDGDVLVKLESVIRGHVEHTCRNLVQTTVFLHELSSLSADRRMQILGADHAYQGVFAELIEQGQSEGLVRQDVTPRIAALSVLGSTNWIYRWYRPDGAFTAEQVGQELAQYTIRAIGTDKAINARACAQAEIPIAESL